MGGMIGGGVGEKIDMNPDDRPPYPAQEVEAANTFVYYAQPFQGPFLNNGLKTDLQKPFETLQGYNSGLAAAAALARADSNDPRRFRGYYPTTKTITDDLDHAKCDADPIRMEAWEPAEPPYWTFMWVIIMVPKTTDSQGSPAYQLRFYPETDNVQLSDRPNHSYLTEGYRCSALLGYNDMTCYGAGKFHVDQNGRIIAVDSKTGHYFKGFEGNDKKNTDAFLDFLKQLGYDTTTVKVAVSGIGWN